VKSAETDRALYLKYEFPKSAEEALSKYTEGVRELDKARRVAISKLAQARAKLNSAKGQYEVQLRQHKDLQEQLDKCTLSAKKSGLVVYGGGRRRLLFRQPGTHPRGGQRPRAPEHHHDPGHDEDVRKRENPRKLHQEDQKGTKGAHHGGCVSRPAAHR